MQRCNGPSIMSRVTGRSEVSQLPCHPRVPPFTIATTDAHENKFHDHR
jgi:hypothetical protein